MRRKLCSGLLSRLPRVALARVRVVFGQVYGFMLLVFLILRVAGQTAHRCESSSEYQGLG